MIPSDRPIRVAVYGTGKWARQTHLPNLLKLSGVAVVAVCDANPEALQSASETFRIPSAYTDAHDMLRRETLDALYSVVPAFARTDVEAEAARKGIHLFSEKPQALRMAVARAIDAAVRQSGVISTVCFRERYRPLFQKARDLLRGKEVVHVRFQSVGPLPVPPAPGQETSWWSQFEKSGGNALDWGVHAVDYVRFMTGLDITHAQAFYLQRSYPMPLSSSFHFRLSNDATMTATFLSTAPGGRRTEPWFTIFFEGGHMALHGYERIEVDGETVFQGQDFDPWFEQTRVFIQAIRTGDRSLLLNDYHDGLFSLAPILAGWESSRRDGACIDVAEFMEA